MAPNIAAADPLIRVDAAHFMAKVADMSHVVEGWKWTGGMGGPADARIKEQKRQAARHRKQLRLQERQRKERQQQRIRPPDIDGLRADSAGAQPLRPEGEPRVLNANFADEGSDHRLGPTDQLIPGRRYELHVQIGESWPDSIVTGNAKFPTEALPPSDRGHLLDVVFAGDGFSPKLVSGQIHLPVVGVSSPVIDGRLLSPGPLRLGVTAMRTRAESEDRTARGRLFIYFHNNLLQSASVAMRVSDTPLAADGAKPNLIEVDYRLTPDFVAVGERFSARKAAADMNIRRMVDDRVRVNLAHNDNGPSQKLVVIGSDDGLPPMAIPYQATDAISRLNQARAAVLECNEGLNATNSKPLPEFERDTRRLADLGSQIYLDVIGQVPNSWARSLRGVLEAPSLIQISHTGPVPYAFPWPLLYDYILDADENLWRTCEVIRDHAWSMGNGAPYETCPYGSEDWHEKNVVCPFGFWGLRHLIEEPVSAPRVFPPLHLGSRLDVGIAATDDPAMRNVVRNHLEELREIVGIRFTPPKPALKDDEVFNMLKTAGLAYFLCHNDSVGNDSWLRIQSTSSPRISTKELIRWGLRQDWDATGFEARAPIIFLNACHSAAVTPGQVVTWVGDFMRLGASAVLGTEIDVRVEVATEFAMRFFTALLAGPKVPLGQAIREARWALVRKGNLLGLSYTLYGLADIWIE
jgi:hypothetical protein